MNALGLGGYGSEDEEMQEEGQRQQRLISASGSDDDENRDQRSSDAGAGPEQAAAARQQTPEVAGASGTSLPDVSGGQGQDGMSPAGAALQPDLLKTLPDELRNPPPGEPPPDVVAKCLKMVALKRDERRVFNDSLRSHKGYRNPDLLTKLVEHWGVDQYGSAFDQAVFDPKGLPEEDKIGALMQQWEREQDRRRVARENVRPEQLRAGAAIEFQRGQGALGALPVAASGSTNDLRHQSLVNTAMLRQQAALQAALAVNMQAVKRSKWDAGAK